jgi:hypothetical protein
MAPVAKGDFFLLFWRAWQASFIERTVVRSFEATGVWPMDRSVILKRFKATPSQRPQALREAPFSRLNRQVRAAVPNPSSEAAKSLSQTLHQLHTQIALVTDENEGLREALSAKKKHKKKGKPLTLESEEPYNGGVVWWSPTKVQQARDRQRRKEEDKRVAEAAKRTRK